MVRYLPILLGACVAIVSGLIGAVGVRSLAQHERLSADPTTMTFRQFATQRPDDTYHFELTNLSYGASVYPNPMRPDGEWEKVYVCLFSRDTKRLGKNYISVIAEIDGVKGTDELSALLEDGKLDVYFWPRRQGLPKSVYNRMAQRYRGMQFNRCLHVESGGPPPNADFGNGCIYVGIGGVAVSVLFVVIFYVVKFIGMLISNRRDPWYDEEEHQVNNKAGLPSA